VSAYLARLVERSDGDTGHVRPRLPSLFEPVGQGHVPEPSPGRAGEELGAVEERSLEPHAAADRPADRTAPRDGLRTADQDDRLTTTSPTKTGRRRAPGRSAVPPDPRIGPAEPPVPSAEGKAKGAEPARREATRTPAEALRIEASRVAPPSVASRITPRQGPEPPEPLEASPQTGAPAVGVTPGPGLERSSVPPRGLEFPPAHERGRLTEVRRETTAPLTSSRIPIPPPHQQILPARPVSPALVSMHGESPPTERVDPPIVRITIGRIDVRAVPPSPPADVGNHPSTRRRPEMSLEDYLKRRNGRGS
jgi:hypothetical protein